MKKVTKVLNLNEDGTIRTALTNVVIPNKEMPTTDAASIADMIVKERREKEYEELTNDPTILEAHCVEIKRQMNIVCSGSPEWYKLCDVLHQILRLKVNLHCTTLSSAAGISFILKNMIGQIHFHNRTRCNCPRRMVELYGRELPKRELLKFADYIMDHQFDFPNWLMRPECVYNWMIHQELFALLLDEYIRMCHDVLFNPEAAKENIMLTQINKMNQNKTKQGEVKNERTLN